MKFHWKPRLGVHSLLWEEAQLAGGVDPDFHRRDLADAIESGALPEWDLGVQIFPESADQMFEGIDLLDPTKIVPEELAPVQILGTMTLTANPTNYFAETEQVAFHPGHMPPGIDVTADPLLQGRLFSYLDTQISRLGGPNFSQIPVNRPHADINDMYRDGMHQTAVHQGVAPYRPNSLDGGMPDDATVAEGALVDSPVSTDGTAVRAAPQSFSDHFSQPRMFYRSLSRVEQDHTVDAYIFELSKCERTEIRQRVVDVLAGVDGALARRVADGLGLVPRSPEATESSLVSPALSQVLGSWPVDGRKVGILVSDNSGPAEIAATVEAVKGGRNGSARHRGHGGSDCRRWRTFSDSGQAVPVRPVRGIRRDHHRLPSHGRQCDRNPGPPRRGGPSSQAGSCLGPRPRRGASLRAGHGQRWCADCRGEFPGSA